jgi:hypothetical protein
MHGPPLYAVAPAQVAFRAQLLLHLRHPTPSYLPHCTFSVVPSFCSSTMAPTVLGKRTRSSATADASGKGYRRSGRRSSANASLTRLQIRKQPSQRAQSDEHSLSFTMKEKTRTRSSLRRGRLCTMAMQWMWMRQRRRSRLQSAEGKLPQLLLSTAHLELDFLYPSRRRTRLRKHLSQLPRRLLLPLPHQDTETRSPAKSQ